MVLISFLPSSSLPAVLRGAVISVVGFAGIVGLQYAGLLVHRTARSGPAVPGLDLRRAAQLLLDDRLLQPSGLPDSYETGTHSFRRPACAATAVEQSRWPCSHMHTNNNTHNSPFVIDFNLY